MSQIKDYRTEDQRNTHTVLILRTHHWEGNLVTAFPTGTDPKEAMASVRKSDICRGIRPNFRVLESLESYQPTRKTIVVTANA